MKMKEQDVSQTITLPLDATVLVTDSTGTAVERESWDAALQLIRRRIRPSSYVVAALGDTAERFSTSQVLITADDVSPTGHKPSVDYTLNYDQYLITDSSGVTRGVQLDQVDAIAQSVADAEQTTVEVASVLPGLDPWLVEPQALSILDPAPDTQDASAAPSAASPAGELSQSAADEAQDDPNDPAQRAGDDPDTEQPAQEHATGDEDHHTTTSFSESFARSHATRKDVQGPAEDGWRGAFNRAFLLKMRPGPHERRMRQLRTTIQQGLAGSKTVMFCNLKGGGRKTTNTHNVSAIIGRVRGGNILAWDTNENSGDLVDRGRRAPHGRTAIDLYDHLDELTTLENVDKLTHYMHPQGDNRFEILASQDEKGTKPVIDGTAFKAMHPILRTFYSLVLVDTGNASTASTWQAAAEAADVVVITMENAKNSVRLAARTLDAIREQVGEAAVANAVAVINQPQKQSRAAKDRTTDIYQLLEPRMRAVLEVPFDHALKEGEEIVWESLSRHTREAYLHVGAAVVEGL